MTVCLIRNSTDHIPVSSRVTGGSDTHLLFIAGLGDGLRKEREAQEHVFSSDVLKMRNCFSVSRVIGVRYIRDLIFDIQVRIKLQCEIKLLNRTERFPCIVIVFYYLG